jgi:hypothetical protein
MRNIVAQVVRVAILGILAGAIGLGQAQESGSTGGVGLTAKVGTLGLGGDLTLGINDYLGVRVQGNWLKLSGYSRADEGTYYIDANLNSYGVLLDVHPFGGGFRLSGGLLANRNNLDLRADLTAPVELDDQDFLLSDFTGKVTFEETAPYLGFGFGNAAGRDGRWHFACDFGVMIQGSPMISASATSSLPELQPAVDAALANDVADLQDDVDPFKYYPVISFGVSYRF